MNKTSGLYRSVRVDAAGAGVVSQAGGVLLESACPHFGVRPPRPKWLTSRQPCSVNGRSSCAVHCSASSPIIGGAVPLVNTTREASEHAVRATPPLRTNPRA